jgi:hypothetical protein
MNRGEEVGIMFKVGTIAILCLACLGAGKSVKLLWGDPNHEPAVGDTGYVGEVGVISVLTPDSMIARFEKREVVFRGFPTKNVADKTWYKVKTICRVTGVEKTSWGTLFVIQQDSPETETQPAKP